MRRVALFARPPVPGRVKTRLSPALPAELACRLYAAMLRDVMAVVTSAACDERILYWAEDTAAAPPPGWVARRQNGDSLGARLASAFDELLASPDDQAIVLGGDCPDLDSRTLETAFEALARSPLTLGPAADGGYYLIGLARRAAGLFEGVDWGSAAVLDQTLARARAAGLAPVLLERLDDIDTPADLVRWIARQSTGSAASGAAEELRSMGLLPRRA